jgi:hypothetical protein
LREGLRGRYEDTWDKILPHNVVGTWNAADILRTPDTEDAISREFHGGPYTQMGFDGDRARIE